MFSCISYWSTCFFACPCWHYVIVSEQCSKLAPQYCGPFEILKQVGSSAYHLALPRNVGIHHGFHVNRLKPYLRSSDNTIAVQDLVTWEAFSYKPHVLEWILDSRTKLLRSKEIQLFKIKLMDKSIDDATREHEHTLRHNFLTLFRKKLLYNFVNIDFELKNYLLIGRGKTNTMLVWEIYKLSKTFLQMMENKLPCYI